MGRPESRAATSSSSTVSKQRRCSHGELRFTRSRFYSEVAHPLGKDNSQASDDSKAFLFRIWFPSSIVEVFEERHLKQNDPNSLNLTYEYRTSYSMNCNNLIITIRRSTCTKLIIIIMLL